MTELKMMFDEVKLAKAEDVARQRGTSVEEMFRHLVDDYAAVSDSGWSVDEDIVFTAHSPEETDAFFDGVLDEVRHA